jgi:tRNA nucleotidyltransferase/poly(A) polymerase
MAAGMPTKCGSVEDQMIDKIAPEAVAELRSLRERIKALDPTCDVFLVGGYLRDLIINGEAKGDFDYVTNLHPDKAAELGFNRVGEAFPVFLTDQGSELACTRTERKTGTGYNGFTTEFTPSFRDDALRRDLTVNTVLWNPEIGLVFPVESAIEDFSRQELNACTDAFAEDPLRVFRVARFSQRFRWHVGSGVQRLCLQVAEEACTLDANRVREEVDKVLAMNCGVELFYGYLPNRVRDHWFGPEYLPRETTSWWRLSWPHFYRATRSCPDRELSWAWLALGAKDPEAFLARFDKPTKVFKVLQQIIQLQIETDMMIRETELSDILQLWGSIKRGVVPYETWRNLIQTILSPEIVGTIDFFNTLPTKQFKNANERNEYYVSSCREVQERAKGEGIQQG